MLHSLRYYSITLFLMIFMTFSSTHALKNIIRIKSKLYYRQSNRPNLAQLPANSRCFIHIKSFGADKFILCEFLASRHAHKRQNKAAVVMVCAFHSGDSATSTKVGYVSVCCRTKTSHESIVSPVWLRAYAHFFYSRCGHFVGLSCKF